MTLDRLAAELGYRPANLRWVIDQLRDRYPGLAPASAEGELDPVVAATIRSVVAGIEYAVRACPDLH